MSDRKKDDEGPKLLAGGDPQIPKGEGDGPVQDHIAAMPGWKRDVGKRLDELIAATVPDVHKAVKWNQPFYGLQGEGGFLSFRCYTKYLQVQFWRGTSLDPMPPKASRPGALPRHPRGRSIGRGPTPGLDRAGRQPSGEKM